MTCLKCNGAGWAKWYVGKDKPTVPLMLKADDDGIRWLGGGGEGYALVRCPVCNSDLGPTKAEKDRHVRRDAA